MHRPITFFASTDLVVIGCNPELADADNPRGEIVGSAAYVYAEDMWGNRVRQHVATAQNQSAVEQACVESRASALAEALCVRLSLGKLPVGFDSWEDARPAYGSLAYEAYGQDDDLALERREAEDF